MSVLVEVEVDGTVVDGDADVERPPVAAPVRGGQLVHRVDEREPGPHRALGVVLVRDREAEGRQRCRRP